MHFKLPFIKPKSIKPKIVSDEEKRCIVNWLSKNIILNCCDKMIVLKWVQSSL